MYSGSDVLCDFFPLFWGMKSCCFSPWHFLLESKLFPDKARHPCCKLTTSSNSVNKTKSHLKTCIYSRAVAGAATQYHLISFCYLFLFWGLPLYRAVSVFFLPRQNGSSHNFTPFNLSGSYSSGAIWKSPLQEGTPATEPEHGVAGTGSESSKAFTMGRERRR